MAAFDGYVWWKAQARCVMQVRSPLQSGTDGATITTVVRSTTANDGNRVDRTTSFSSTIDAPSKAQDAAADDEL